MARNVFEQNTQVFWVPTISNINAPTQAELRAGTEITSSVTKDGLVINPTSNTVQANDLGTSFDAEVPGSSGLKLSLKMFRETPTEAAWNLIKTYNTRGNLVVSWFGFTGKTPTTGDTNVSVYPVATLRPEPAASAANTAQTYTVPMAITATPSDRITVA